MFTKPARAGRVKTRLIGELLAEQAAELHAAFRDDLVDRLAEGPFNFSIAWALEEGESLPTHRLPGLRQRGDDLGRRLHAALAEAGRTHAVVAAVGSDHPLLTVERAAEAFRRVEAGADVAIGPATDGGYYLIAVRTESLSESIFRDVPWSTDRVLATTLERCREAGLDVALLPEGSDVDTPSDLARLARDLVADESPESPRTRALLERWGRLPEVSR